MSEPRCPACGWRLEFTAEGYSWVARCWNKRPPKPCPVDVVPASVNEALAAFLREHRDTDTRTVAEHFGWTPSNANNHLTSLLRIGVAARHRVQSRHGKRFVWRLA